VDDLNSVDLLDRMATCMRDPSNLVGAMLQGLDAATVKAGR
jgi:hypothetical protein